MRADWLVRVFTPDWLDWCNVKHAADTALLRAMPEIDSEQRLTEAMLILVNLEKRQTKSIVWAPTAATAFAYVRLIILEISVGVTDIASVIWDLAWAAGSDAPVTTGWASLQAIVGKMRAGAADLIRRIEGMEKSS